MSAFSDVNGMPATASKFLLRQVLRDEWKFGGFVVSDAKAVEQLIAQGAVVALLFVGEPANYSGEAHNRAYLTLPGAQLDLIKAVQATGSLMWF
jgi:precorrin-2 methylase